MRAPFARLERGPTLLLIRARIALPESILLEGQMNVPVVHQGAARVTRHQAARLVSRVRFPSIRSAPNAKRGNTRPLGIPPAHLAVVRANIVISWVLAAASLPPLGRSQIVTEPTSTIVQLESIPLAERATVTFARRASIAQRVP